MKKSTKMFFALLTFLGMSAFGQAPVVDFSWTPANPCPGQTIQVTGIITSGTVTSWGYSLTGATAGNTLVQNPVVTFTMSGVNTFTLVGLNGLTPSLPVAKSITMAAAPVLTVTSASPVVCSGNSVVITATGAATYSWMPGGQTTNTIAVTPTANATYSVIGTGTNACASTYTITQWTASLAVSSTTNMLCSGSSATLNAGYGVTYSWSPGGQSTKTIVVSPTVTTSYTVTDATCSLTANFTQSVTTCVGLNERNADVKSFGMYPNPAVNEVVLEFNNNFDKNVTIVDITGKNVMLVNSNESKLTLNISTLNQGVYFVKIQSNNKTEYAKLIKE
jgi:hypothetical protein